MMPLSLAYSPCPNDTFVFAAWTQGLLPGAPSVRVALDDVEALNRAARRGEHDLTKVSYGAIPGLLDRYRILRSGGALGRGCGPLVVAPAGGPTTLAELPETATIAIPGEATTAFLLLRLALGRRPNVRVMRFDGVVEAVARGEVDAGLIIHESRFTYARAGLVALADLGAWWEAETGRPIPLGAILIRRDRDDDQARTIEATIRSSLEAAYARPAAIAPYVRAHAFEMDEAVMRAHVDLYVNAYTRDVGPDGEAAVVELFDRARRAGLVAGETPLAFVPA